MPYLKPLITLNFWFTMTPPPFVNAVFIALGVLLIALFLAGAAFKVLSWKKRGNPPLHRVLSRGGRFFLAAAFLGLFLYFVSYEQIRFISMRFWWLVLAVGMIVWAVFIVRDTMKRYPAEKKALAERLAKEKYLPK